MSTFEEPRFTPVRARLESLGEDAAALVSESLAVGFRDGINYAAEKLDYLAHHTDTPALLTPVFEQIGEALRLTALET